MKTEQTFDLICRAVDPATLRLCAVGDWVKTWTKPGLSELFVYCRGSVGGTGLIGTVAKHQVPQLADNHLNATSAITRVEGSDVEIRFTWPVDEDPVPPCDSPPHKL